MYTCSKSKCDIQVEKRGYCEVHRKEYNHQHYRKRKPEPRVKLSDDELKRRRAIRKATWAKNNRDKLNAAQARYRKTTQGKDTDKANKGRRRHNGATFTANEWRQLCEYYNNTCLCCGCNDCQLTPDHVIPLSKSGSGMIENIQPLCLTCNLKKGTKIHDYRQNSIK